MIKHIASGADLFRSFLAVTRNLNYYAKGLFGHVAKSSFLRRNQEKPEADYDAGSAKEKGEDGVCSWTFIYSALSFILNI